MLTFGELKASKAVDVAGVCATSDQFKGYVNEAVNRLLRRGDFTGSTVPIQVCVKRGCMVFPRYVHMVRKINVCRHPIPTRNLWYEFLPDNDRWWYPLFTGHSGCSLTNDGRTPVYSDVPGEGKLIRAYLVYNEDIGKTVTIFGVDNNGQELRTNNGDGTWSEGIVLALTKPFASTSTYVRRIDRVLKDETEGDVRLFAYDPVTDILDDIALYGPSETNPDYERYRLNAATWPSTTTPGAPNCCNTSFSVVALVKLRFFPVKHDTDLVIIDNVEAIKDMIQSIRFGEAGDFTNADKAEIRALRELNMQIADHNPEPQIAVSNDVFGSTGIGVQACF